MRVSRPLGDDELPGERKEVDEAADKARYLADSFMRWRSIESEGEEAEPPVEEDTIWMR